jgi:hypothetical protein
MTIDRRLRDRKGDEASDRWLWKLVGLAVVVSIAVYAFIRATH